MCCATIHNDSDDEQVNMHNFVEALMHWMHQYIANSITLTIFTQIANADYYDINRGCLWRNG